jgi:hypothetical protein
MLDREKDTSSRSMIRADLAVSRSALLHTTITGTEFLQIFL